MLSAAPCAKTSRYLHSLNKAERIPPTPLKKGENPMKRILLPLLLPLALLLSAITPAARVFSQADDPSPPAQPVKLIFIHHSTGGNWLQDGYGDLGRTLGENNYFVSDTNYGWGPDGIGDRTDIPDWEEWFASEETPRYMQALFTESGRHADYTRTLPDPGGENEIVMFKSCFPNSALEGSPNDPPDPEGWLTVGHAKYVYNRILQYFAARPDKLFIVITAPPLSDPAHAANARAFNQWLVNDWLRENDYTLGNVAVFDFYNVLTGPDGHHTFRDGREIHSVAGQDTLYYPSEDDHPSAEGSRKATAEFVPLLNVFYHRWRAGLAAQPPLETTPEATLPLQPAETPMPLPLATQPALTGSLLDDFEGGAPPGTEGWETFWDEATATSIHCAPQEERAHGGKRALLLDFDVAPNAWATCALFYEQPQDWSAALGVTFYLRAAQAGTVFDLNLYAGSSAEERETYLYTFETPPESTQGWIPVRLTWEQFHRADWEAEGGAPFSKADSVVGMAFGMGTYRDAPNTGTLWIDDLALLEDVAPPPQQAAPPPAPTAGEAQPTPSPVPTIAKNPPRPEGRGGLPCLGSLLWPLALAALALRLR